MHTYALCGYTRHLRICWYAAVLDGPSGISQAAAIAKGVLNEILVVNRKDAYENICSFKH